MLAQENTFTSPEVKELICGVLRDDSLYENKNKEMRSVARQRLVCPVTVRFMNGEDSLAAFSRNISPQGIGLISENPIEPNQVAILQIYRLEQPTSDIVAECRWCERFGDKFFVSGWKFMRVPKG